MLARLLTTVTLACATLPACSGTSEGEQSLTQAIVDGEPSGADQDAVVLVVFPSSALMGPRTCTGTLVAPSLVLTSKRCVAPFVDGSFVCTSEGYLDSTRDRAPFNAGEFGLVAAPEAVSVYVGPDPELLEPAARGRSIHVVPTDSICRNDIALIELDRELALEPKSMRLDRGVALLEETTVVGYGAFGQVVRSSRSEKSGLRVEEIGRSDFAPDAAGSLPRTFTLGVSACGQNDAGAPSLSSRGGEILGVFSFTSGQDCNNSLTRNVFTQLAPYGAWLNEVFETVGYPAPQPDVGNNGGSAGAGARGGAPNGADVETSAQGYAGAAAGAGQNEAGGEPASEREGSAGSAGASQGEMRSSGLGAGGCGCATRPVANLRATVTGVWCAVLWWSRRRLRLRLRQRLRGAV